MRVVSPGSDGLARHPSAQRSIRIRTYRRTSDAGTNRQGEAFCARLDANAVEGNGRSRLTQQSRRRTRPMKSWFVPPIVIPILIAASLVGYVSFSAFLR